MSKTLLNTSHPKHIAHFVPNTSKPTPNRSYHDYLEHQGRIYKGVDQVGKLYRELQTGVLEIYRDKKLCLTINVDKRKKRMLIENKKKGFVSQKYQDFKYRLEAKQGSF